MITLNLTTNCVEHTVLKEYLEENVSATLADKINHGVLIEKDGQRLLNRKDLNGFMQYACDEARRLAATGATSACMKSDIIFGWAIHYFEEDDIIGKLFNEDGSEYTPPKPEYKPTQLAPAPTVPEKTVKPQPAQASLFDFLSNKDNQSKDERTEETINTPIQGKNAFDNMQTIGFIHPTEEPKTLVLEPFTESNDEEENDDIYTLNVDMETGEVLSPIPPKHSIPIQPYSPLYQKYLSIQGQYPHAVIAYRLGNFFEIFGDSAVKVSKHLDLTLTGRDFGLPERIAMVGFPYHTSDTYFRKIANFSQLIIVEDNTASTYVLTEKTPIAPPVKKESEATTFEDSNDYDEFKEERALQKFFDKDALCSLYELFNYSLDMQ